VPCVEQLAHINRTHGVGGGSMAGAVIRRWFPSRLVFSRLIAWFFASSRSTRCTVGARCWWLRQLQLELQRCAALAN